MSPPQPPSDGLKLQRMLKSLVQHIDSTFELEEFRADSFVKRVDAAVRAGGLVRGQLCCITKPV